MHFRMWKKKHVSTDITSISRTSSWLLCLPVRPSLEPGWLEGTLNGKTGLVPENYVEFLPWHASSQVAQCQVGYSSVTLAHQSPSKWSSHLSVFI